MKILVKSFLLTLILFLVSHGNTLVSKNLYDKNISMKKGSFKVFQFEKVIKNIKVSNKDLIEVEFVNNENKPLQTIKVFTKELGYGNILVTFEDTTSLHINVNITQNLETIINIAKYLSPKLKVEQTNKKVILSGKIQNQKTKDKILDLFKKSGIDLKNDLVDLTALINPDKMVRIKLYAVEINNDKGLDLKNNWMYSFQNYTTSYEGTKKTLYSQKEKLAGYTPQVADLIENSVSLTGGLTAAANYLGNGFNTGLVLNYLSSKGVAKVIDETTLLTLENKEADFLAGGTFNIKTQTTTAQGVPATELKEIKYGLQLNIKAKNIVDEKFVKLNIVTKSSAPDFSEVVDGIPNITEKSITTNVVVANKSTIILGGLVNREDATSVEKIPLLGDIPILGFLFTSKAFKEGKSELAFFITPEIVDPKLNSQEKLFTQKTEFKSKVDKTFEEKTNEEKTQKVKKQIENKQNDVKSLHQKRVNELLGL